MEDRAPGAPSRGEQLTLFAKEFFKHPRMLGSIIPSSRFLIRRLMRQIDWDRARVLVEYGPGVGTITRAMLRRMRDDAALIVIETNPDFVDYLRRTTKDERLIVVHGSAADTEKILAEHGFASADYVISGIPFTTLPEEVREQVLQATRAVVQSNGVFLVYQFSETVLPYLERNFSSVSRDFEPFNVLPAQTFYCVP